MAKNNLRSFCYSDEVAAILEAQEGKNLNDKFENLVLTCFYRLPEIRAEIKRLQQQQLAELDKLWALRGQLEELGRLSDTLHTAQHYLKLVVRKAEKIAGSEKIAGDDVTQS